MTTTEEILQLKSYLSKFFNQYANGGSSELNTFMRLMELQTQQQLEAIDTGLVVDRQLPSWQRFYCGVKNAAQVDTVLANNLYAYPIIVDKTCKGRRMSAQTVGTSSGKSAVIGVYSSLNGYPDKILGEVTINLGVSGYQYADFAAKIDLPKGTYWYSWLAEASVTWRTIQPDWSVQDLIGFPFGSLTSYGYTRLQYGLTYQSSLPDVFPANANPQISNNPIFNIYCE